MAPPARPLTSDPIDVLLRHDEWATRRLLELCLALSDEEFDRPFGIGPGSLRATLVHVVTRYRYWADTIAERAGSAKPRRPSLAGRPSAAALLEALGPAMEDLRAVASDAVRTGLDRAIRTTWSDAPRLTKGAALVHVATHSMHHRAQCLIMLRRLGREEVKAAADHVSVAEWQSETEAGTRLPPQLPAPSAPTRSPRRRVR